MDSTQATIIAAVGALSFACMCGYIRRCLQTRQRLINTPQMPQASEYTPVTHPITQVIQNPLPSAPIYQPPQQYVVYIPPQQGYSSYPQQYPMSIQPPITQPYPHPGLNFKGSNSS